jgi:CHAD domain-containing protein
MTRGSLNVSGYAERAARERLRTLAANLSRAAGSPEDADAIHDLRVSIRRFSQCLRVFQDLFDTGYRRKMRQRLKKLMTLCGAARNCHIAIEVLEAAQAPATGAVKRRLRRRQRRAESDLAEELKRWESRGTVRSWRGWLKARVEPPRTTAAFAHRVLPRLAREFFRAGIAAARPRASYRQMHQFRLLAKRFRYTLELFAPIYGASGKRRHWERGIDVMRGLQDCLGSINDAAATSVVLAEAGAKGRELRRLRAALNPLIQERTAVFRAYWRQQFNPRSRKMWLVRLKGAAEMNQTARKERPGRETEPPEARRGSNVQSTRRIDQE